MAIKNAKLQNICSYSQSHFENWWKLVENRVLKNKSTGLVKIEVIFVLWLPSVFLSIPLLEFDTQNLSSKMITILDPTSSLLTLFTKKC